VAGIGGLVGFQEFEVVHLEPPPPPPPAPSYHAPPAPVAPARPADVRTWWAAPLLGLGMAVATLVATPLVALPMESLTTSADGGALVPDSEVAMVLALGALAGAAAILWAKGTRALGASRWVALGLGAASGALTAMALASAAHDVAVAPVVDGRTTVDAPNGPGTLLIALAVMGLCIYGGARRWRGGEAMRHVGVTILSGVGVAGLLFAVWTMGNAPTLRSLAVAREHHNVPGLSLVLALAAVAALAWARGRTRRP
jgi:hypothetical protein